MFSLAQGIYRELTFVPERRVLILGLESAGKSSILEWIKHLPKPVPPSAESLKKINSTVGLNVFSLRLPSERLLFWDLGGSEKLRPIWEPYIKQADAVVWVVDCSDHTSISNSSSALAAIVKRPHLARSPLLVLANKQDAEGAIDGVALAVAFDILANAEIRSQCVQPVSARTGAGIREGIEWLAEQLRTSPASGPLKTSIK